MAKTDDAPASGCHCPTATTRRCLVEDVLRRVMLSAGGNDMDRVIADALEEALRRHVPLRWFRLRPSQTPLPAESSGDGVGGTVLRLPIPARSAEGGWMVEVGLPPGHVVSSAERQAVARAAAIWELAAEVGRRRGPGPSALWRHGAVRDGAAPLIGRSQAMRSLRERIERVAAANVTVLIEGESGSGKELVARQIHDLSARRRGPFVAVNCAALVESLLEAELFGIEDRTATGVRGRRGKFEHAAGGTLFLDEVADLSPSAQAKLLRAIQDTSIERVGGNVTHHVDLRLVVATNRCLRDRVAEGAFRADLYYRLSGVELIVPPLRTRREDVVELADYFLTRRGGGQTLTLTPEVVEALHIYDWPGNVRELERMMEAVIVLTQGDRVQLIDLPQSVRGRYAEILEPSLAERESLRGWGSRYVHLVWQRCGQNKREACRVLDISYHTLQVHLTAFRGAAPLAGAEETRRDRWPTPLMLPAAAGVRMLDGNRHGGSAQAAGRSGASRGT